MDADEDSEGEQDFGGTWSLCTTGDDAEPCTIPVDTVFAKVHLKNNIMGVAINSGRN